MKNFIYKSMLVLLLFSFAACQDTLEDLYQDPDGFSKAQADNAGGVSVIAGFFASQTTRNFFLRGDYGSQFHQIRSGSPIMGTGIQMYNVTPASGREYVLINVENDWGSNAFNRTVFNRINSDWIKQILWAQREINNVPEEEKSNLDELFINLLHVLKAYAYQRSTDLYDRVPYFETGSAGALEGDRAEYLGQQDIYPRIIEELKGLDDYFASLELTDQEQAIFSNQDVIFNGDLLQWRKYINSLRLRCAMTVSEMLPELTRTVISEMNGKPRFSEFNDVAGLADIAIVDPARLQVELGITRAFRERPWETRAPKRFLQDVMNVIPDEKSIEINGETLLYYDGDNVEEGLLDGTVDPRVKYLYSADAMGRYIGAERTYDNFTDPNSHFSKMMRGYYINHPIMTDINVTSIQFGRNNEHEIILNDEAAADLSKREEFLLNAFRQYCASYGDTRTTHGTNRNLMAEYNPRPQFNFDLRLPTLHAVETELSLAEAAVRGFGTLDGSAREHYRRAIELSCAYWYDINANNDYSQSTVPSFPRNMDPARIARDRPEMEYDPSAFAEFKAQQFDAMSPQEQVTAIFEQLQLHYNFFNWETPYTAARRLVKYLGDNPANTIEIVEWKERFLYNPNIQASDPENWAIISTTNDENIPVWFTGRTEKWRNVLER